MSNQTSLWNGKAKPFLKWAGGKRQLLDEIEKRLPPKIKKTKKIKRYVEPFVGGGAVFFYLQNNYDIDESIILDINRELILGYKVVKKDVEKLIDNLHKVENEYIKMNGKKRKEKYYYDIRTKYNNQMRNFDYKNYNKDWIERATYLIFLNKTCFNGLFRQNKKGEFNVPFGRYKKPNICDEENLLNVNKVLEKTRVFCKDFKAAEKYINDKTFVYFDPPYLPISKTSSFTSYAKEDFTIEDQKRLAKFFKNLHLEKRAFLMLSNSDPKNEDQSNNFFEENYSLDEFKIDRVEAKRYINCNGNDRGKIYELIIRNYNA